MLSKDRLIENRVKQIRKLKQYKGKTENELIETATQQVEQKIKSKLFRLEGDYSGSEKKFAQLLFDKYIENSYVEHPGEVNTLNKLIFLEVLAKRIENQLNIRTTSEKEKNKFIPKYVMGDYLALLDKIMGIKKQLGVLGGKDNNFLEFWVKFLKKLKIYVSTHSGEFYFKCPYCKQMALILRKIKDYDTFPFTMFRGTKLYNEKLLSLIEEGRLTVREVSEVWGLPRDDYVKGIYEKIYLEERRQKSLKSQSSSVIEPPVSE